MKKLALLAVSILFVISLMAGCNTTQTPTVSSPQTSTSAGTTPAGTTKGTTAPIPKTEMTLMMISGTTHNLINAELKRLTTEFSSNNAYNTTIKHETFESEQYKSKIATLMASNAQPDIFFTWEAGFLRPFVEGGKVYPVGDALNKDSEWKGRFLDGVFGPLTYKDGKIYGVPNTMQLGVAFYNTKIFADNKLQEPKTWDEFMNACETIKKAGIIPMTLPSQKSWIASELMQEIANGVGGADLFNKISSGKTTWDEARFVQAAQIFQSLVTKGYFQPGFLGMTNDEGRDLFKNEKAAMYFIGSWDLPTLINPEFPVADSLGVFKLPSANSENSGTVLGSVGYCFGISASAKNIQGATAMVRMLSNPDVQQRLAYDNKLNLATNVKLDATKLDKITMEMQDILSKTTTLTPWYDRVFGAGEGTEFNNAAVAIAAGKSPAEQMKALEAFAVANGAR